MRDKARIDRMLQLVRLVWEQSPDLRLGQLLSNAAHSDDSRIRENLFTVEDSVIETGLKESLDLLTRMAVESDDLGNTSG